MNFEADSFLNDEPSLPRSAGDISPVHSPQTESFLDTELTLLTRDARDISPVQSPEHLPLLQENSVPISEQNRPQDTFQFQLNPSSSAISLNPSVQLDSSWAGTSSIRSQVTFVAPNEEGMSAQKLRYSPDKCGKNSFLYYTGFANYEKFKEILQFVVPNEDRSYIVRYGSKLKPELRITADQLFSADVDRTCLPYSQVQRTPCRKARPGKLTLEDEFLLFLIRLRQGFYVGALADLFRIDISTASTTLTTWTNYLFVQLGQLKIWPHRDTIIAQHPRRFHEEHPDTIVILDATEFKVETPSSLVLQSAVYSNYKSTQTLKGLIAIEPRGGIIFVSQLFPGSISDKELVLRSGILELMQTKLDAAELLPGDVILADKGFLIAEEVEKLGLRLNIPPFKRGQAQFTPEDVELTKSIARHRVHVERAIRKVKCFALFQKPICASMFGTVNQLWTISCLLTNFQPPIIIGN